MFYEPDAIECITLFSDKFQDSRHLITYMELLTSTTGLLNIDTSEASRVPLNPLQYP